MNLDLGPDGEERLLDSYRHLTPWPDTVDTVRALKRSDVRLDPLLEFVLRAE